MKDWFKPLFVYKKYLLAEKLLSSARQCRFSLDSESGDQPYFQMEYYDTNVSSSLTKKELGMKERVLEALDLLFSNKHIIKTDGKDFFSIKMKCTKEGERALNAGFYRRKIISESWKIFASIVLAIGGIITLIIKVVK